MNKLFIININEISNIEDLYIYLDEDRINKIINYKNEVNKKQSALAGLFIKAFLNDKIIQYNENGKPYTDDLYFSISHSNSYVIFNISDTLCGVDMEIIKHHKINKYLFDDELNHNDEEIIKMWTLKEAAIKALGLTNSNIKEKIIFENNKIKFMNNEFYYKEYNYNNYIINIVNENNDLPILEEISLDKLLNMIKKKCD